MVIPVYQGEKTLESVVSEVLARSAPSVSDGGHAWRVIEVILVHDHGPDDSAAVMRALAQGNPAVRPIWLSRNFGQHAATLAGISSSSGEWVVTMDEDGQHDPGDIGALLDAAMAGRSALVYASPSNPPPHSGFRNAASRAAKLLVNKFNGGADARLFHSYRLVLGDVGRSVAAYAGAGVYLDIALSWVVGTPVTASVPMRDEGDRTSGYSLRTLVSHFWRMVLTGGTRALRLVSLVGLFFAIGGLTLAAVLVVNKLTGANVIAGWTSLAVVLLVCTGVMLLSLGVIAEYLGVAVNMAMGRPPYLITRDPMSGPLGDSDQSRGTYDRA